MCTPEAHELRRALEAVENEIRNSLEEPDHPREVLETARMVAEERPDDSTTRNADEKPSGQELERWLEAIDQGMHYIPASARVISCGTVTVDLALGKVLLVWNGKYNIYQLPKGRRNIGESCLQAALRETREETGYYVTPVDVMVATRATMPAANNEKRPHARNTCIESQMSREFVATVICRDPQSESPALKETVFFAATGDSTETPGKDTQEVGERLRAEWVTISEVSSKLRFQAEVRVVEKAMADRARARTAGAAVIGGMTIDGEVEVETDGSETAVGSVSPLSLQVGEKWEDETGGKNPVAEVLA